MDDTNILDLISALPVFSSEPITEPPTLSIAAATENPARRSLFWVGSADAMVIEIEIRRKP